MKHIGFVVLLLLTLNFSNAQNWKIKNSSVTFTIKHGVGSSAEGSFEISSSEIFFSPFNLDKAKIIAIVDAASVNTNNTVRDKTIKGEEYFNSAKYPKITMSLIKVSANSALKFTGTFAVTIKNTTKEITFPFTFTKTADGAQFNGEFSLNRLDYKVGNSSWLLGDDVKIKIVVNVNQ